MLAGHFTSVANAVVCLAAFMPAARQRLAADSWSLGALFPLWSHPLAIGPPLSGTCVFYLSLAGYCLHASLIAAERCAAGVTAERMVLLQRFLVFLLASSVCMVEQVPELALVLLLFEVPYPFVAMMQALQDFRLRSDPLYRVASIGAVFGIGKCRLMMFGFSLACTISHPEFWQKLGGVGCRQLAFSLYIGLFVTYAVHFARLCREMQRDAQDAKDSREVPRAQRASDIQTS